jgi:hypothetical protein
MKAKMFQRRFLVIPLLALAGPWIPQLALAAWPGNPTVNVPICTASGNQEYPQIVSDSSGGAIITWYDNRSGDYDIYARRVDASGAVQWTENGVPICTALYNQERLTIVSDGYGGAIITWQDERSGNYDIYAQRVDASGNVLWTKDGVAICTASYSQWFPAIASDGYGGAIITWRDERTYWYVDIYAQRVDASGKVLWWKDGVPICTASGGQYNPAIVSDGYGGAIITWKDERSGMYSDDIYAQRVDASGVTQWTANGVPICTASYDQWYPTIVSDDYGGAIITWQDHRSDSWDIYAQRVDASGNVPWTKNGVPICTASGEQGDHYNPKGLAIVSDGSGGAIITWMDERSSGSWWDIYAQRVDASGAVQWTIDGVAICTASNEQQYPTIVSDGYGGAIITWQDYRDGSYYIYNYDIYAQRVDASGVTQWTANGVPICTASNGQEPTQEWPTIVSDGYGGAIITWQDKRGGNYDIYAQRVFSDGSLSGPGVLMGDVSGDGSVTAYDASLVLQHIVGLIIIEPEKLLIADVTGDKTISALDAALILQYGVGLIKKFPAAR